MEIYHNDLAFLMEKEGVKVGLFKDWQGYAIGSFPFEGGIKMIINSSGNNEEIAVFNAFKKLMVCIFGEYILQGFSGGVDINLNERTLKITGGSAKNSFSLHYLGDSIIISFNQNLEQNNNNNRVILDKDGAIFPYLTYFNKFFNNLISLEIKPDYPKRN